MNEEIIILLPSLIHRIGGAQAKQAKVMALEFNCALKRVRRSRNWSLKGEAMQIQSLSQKLKVIDSIEYRYLINKILAGLEKHQDKLEPLEDKLVRLLNENPNITLAELVERSQCTLAEARLARFKSDI